RLLFKLVRVFLRLTQNVRILDKLSMNQHQIIGDVTSIYEFGRQQKFKQQMFKVILLYIGNYLQIISNKIPILAPYGTFKILFKFYQMIFIIILVFIFSLVIFFQKELSYIDILIIRISFYSFIADVLITLNTGILHKGELVLNRTKIIQKYLKKTLIPDLLSMYQLTIFAFFIDYKTGYHVYDFIVCFPIFLKIFNLFGIVEDLAFYFSSRKNLFDLIKLMVSIGSVCHIFSLFWHGFAVYEIKYLNREDTWIHAQNLIEANVYTRYVYSLYYLSATMITVGYGDVVPKNYLECQFSICCMFQTGIVYAYSLNSIVYNEEYYQEYYEAFNHLFGEEEIEGNNSAIEQYSFKEEMKSGIDINNDNCPSIEKEIRKMQKKRTNLNRRIYRFRNFLVT
ncbi:hypothetical protein IMG5_166550, partial [Ichthyophthirius multifiliis]